MHIFSKAFGELKEAKKSSFVLFIAFTVLYFSYVNYFCLFPRDVHSFRLWVCIGIYISIITAHNWITDYFIDEAPISSIFKLLLATNITLIIVVGFFYFAGTPIFNAKKYQQRLQVENVKFEDVIKEISWEQIPMIDKDSSALLGSRKMGTIVNKVSQYDVDSSYTLINYKGQPYRVSPLEYSGKIKYFTNKDDGIPGFISVDTNTKEAKYVELKKSMKYSKSALFSNKLKRVVRQKYPNKFLKEMNFELDDDGNPMYVIPTVKLNKFMCEEYEGTILVNPITGKMKYYKLKDVPHWVDRAVSTSTVLSQIDSWGRYKHGYWNSKFGQKDVAVATDGYNYITLDNDVYLYTGITSVVNDESNIGFMLVNMRTGKAKYVPMASSEEYSAMNSAEGQVQNLGYASTFPILMNIENHPTYFLSLKDKAGLIKMYALVDATDYQKVVVGNIDEGIDVLQSNYLKKISGKLQTDNNEETTNSDVTITVDNIMTAQLDGNTIYYFVSGNKTYIADIKIAQYKLPLVKQGDTLNIKTKEIDENTIKVLKIN